MEDSQVDNEEEYLEHDSLSSGSFSKDSLLNEHNIEENKEKPAESTRRGSYTLETSPQMSNSIRNQHLMEPIYIQTEHQHSPYEAQKSSDISYKSNKQPKAMMSQSMYDRPCVNSGRMSTISSASNQVREEKLRLAKEEQEKKQKQKIAVLNESEKSAQIAKKRKDSELQRKIDENKRKAMERQRIVDERKERLNKAEEARRKTILRKLVNNNGKKPSPQSSNGLMTMSCYGGFGSTRTRPGNKEVVHNRFLNTRPMSSTGRVIGFGSSTPRPICENTIKPHSEHKKIPEAILLKCEILSRPSSSRMSDKMITSVISPQISNTVLKTPQRQSSFKEKNISKKIPTNSSMAISMIDFPSKNKPKVQTKSSMAMRTDLPIKEEMSLSVHQSKKQDIRPTSALSNVVKKSEENTQNKRSVPSKSGTFPRHIRKTKVDTHLDSDSIEEEVYAVRKAPTLPQSAMTDQSSDSLSVEIQAKKKTLEISPISTNDESKPQIEKAKAIPTKDLSEIDYKARLMENRRLVREKREREREQLMKSEREKRHADEMAAREMMEMERENNSYVEETHLVTSNDDALEGQAEIQEDNVDKEDEDDVQLSEIAETPSITQNEATQQFNKEEDEKNERKKRLDSIMSRIRKTNDESSSEGGVSPRRAMSPEPAELEPEINNLASTPAFRSALLQSMMNKGRLSKVSNQNKDNKEETFEGENNTNFIQAPVGINLCPLTESLEDSPSSHLEKPYVIQEPFVSENLNIDREDCDGKEDSYSLNDHKEDIFCQKINGISSENDIVKCSSLSSTETEEEDNVKTPFGLDSVYNSTNINSVVQETCVFQN